MKYFDLDLQHFAGSLTVTVYKDGNITTASASPASSLAKDDEVELTITPASNKELDQILVLAGGVTVDPETKKFTMGESNVVLVVTGKANNIYKIVENTEVIINDSKTTLQRNMMLEVGPNGAIIGVTCDGTALTLDSEIIAQLKKTGAIVKM